MILSDTDEYIIEHHGKKGMKWGVRQRGRIQRNTTVGKGRGSKLDKVRVHLTANPLSVIKNKGFKKAAAAKGMRMEARQLRVSKGKTKIKDLFPLMAATRTTDILPTVRGKKLSRDQSNNVPRLTKGKQAALVVLGIGGSMAVSSLGKAAVRKVVARKMG